MNETVPTETQVQATEVTELVTEAVESPTAAPDEWTEPVAQETEEVILVNVIQESASVVAHVNLFGSFLICGTLVGIFLLRNRHAN